jgi:hypothetical protein
MRANDSRVMSSTTAHLGWLRGGWFVAVRNFLILLLRLQPRLAGFLQYLTEPTVDRHQDLDDQFEDAALGLARFPDRDQEQEGGSVQVPFKRMLTNWPTAASATTSMTAPTKSMEARIAAATSRQ